MNAKKVPVTTVLPQNPSQDLGALARINELVIALEMCSDGMLTKPPRRPVYALGVCGHAVVIDPREHSKETWLPRAIEEVKERITGQKSLGNSGADIIVTPSFLLPTLAVKCGACAGKHFEVDENATLDAVRADSSYQISAVPDHTGGLVMV